MKIVSKQVKSILTKSKLPESDYVINPYIGCSHNCHYCYARFMKRFTGHGNEKWGSFVDIKSNAEKLINLKMRSFKDYSATILLGSVTDAYQPIERKTKLTRSILKQMLKKDCRLSILTKSDLVLRDIDLLSEFSNCSVGLSISYLDDSVRRILEPGACSIDRRLIALKELKNAGIPTYAFIGPIFPTLTPLYELFQCLHGSVDEIWAEALNIKCGCLADLSEALERGFPGASCEIINLTRDAAYWDNTEKLLLTLSQDFKIPLVGFYRH